MLTVTKSHGEGLKQRSMSGRKKAVLSFVTLLVAAGGFVGVGLWLTGDGPVNRAGFQRIEQGMTREEVQGILGGSGSAHDLDWMLRHWGGRKAIASSRWGEAGPDHGEDVVWEGKRHVINVWFDADNRARAAAFYDIPTRELTLWQRLRRIVSSG